jgi:hypothetical protein
MCFFILCLLLKLTLADSCAACSNQNMIGYTICNDLSTLNTTLYYTCNRSKSSLYVVFIAYPPDSDGWVSRVIFPADMGMLWAKVIAAFKKDNIMFIKTYYFKTYTHFIPQKLSFDVWILKAKHIWSLNLNTNHFALSQNSCLGAVGRQYSSKGLVYLHSFLQSHHRLHGLLVASGTCVLYKKHDIELMLRRA